MSDGVSQREFTAVCERLYKTQDAGFAGIHERLDVLNGRTGKGEIDRENLRVRVTSLEKEVFSQPRRRTEDTDGKLPLLTKRETTLVVVGLSVVIAGIKLFLVVGEFAFQFLKATVKP